MSDGEASGLYRRFRQCLLERLQRPGVGGATINRHGIQRLNLWANALATVVLDTQLISRCSTDSGSVEEETFGVA